MSEWLKEHAWKLTQFLRRSVSTRPQTAEFKSHRGTARFEGGFCDTLFRTARKSLILNGEMSEWSIEHAWKTIPASCTERHRNTSSRNRFNDFPPQNASRCEPVNVGVRRRFRADLTQFLHSSQLHLFQYVTTFLGTLRDVCRTPDVITSEVLIGSRYVRCAAVSCPLQAVNERRVFHNASTRLACKDQTRRRWRGARPRRCGTSRTWSVVPPVARLSSR